MMMARHSITRMLSFSLTEGPQGKLQPAASSHTRFPDAKLVLMTLRVLLRLFRSVCLVAVEVEKTKQPLNGDLGKIARSKMVNCFADFTS